jgi:hypothetical protein
MSESHSSQPAVGQPGAEDASSALFANLVIQQTNMALMLLGRVPNPESGETVQDLDAARMFIDQLEMLEIKTKGNLDKREDQLLKQSLTTLRMVFVEAVGSATSQPAASRAPDQPAPPTAAAQPAAASGPSEDEHRKKFSKKY